MFQRPKLVRKNPKRSKPVARNSRGVALITALLLLLLLTGMTVAMVLTANSDMLINGYYRGFRGSFYAADSGLSVVRQAFINQYVGAGGAAFDGVTPPIALGTEATVLNNLNTTYGAGYTTLNAGQSVNSWPASFKLDKDPTKTNFTVTCTASGGTGTVCGTATGVTNFSYAIKYQLHAWGRSTGTQVTDMSDEGTITVNVTNLPGPTTASFAGYGMFIDNYTLCDGTTLVPGTISGPVFTNGSWNFGTSSTSYIFTDKVGSAGSQFGYTFGGSTGCIPSAAASYKSGTTTIAPTFKAGYSLGQQKVPLPTDSFDQKRAIIDGKGTNDTDPSQSEMSTALKNVSGASWPAPPAPVPTAGVYLPYTVNGSGQKVFNGGGIYVKGDASVVLKPTGSQGAQQYVITQGSTVTTVTVDVVNNTTTISSGSTTTTITGVPSQLDPTPGSTTVLRDATLLFVDGNITSLKGPGQGQPALSDQTALTITAANNVTITGDILYTSEPVTLTATTGTDSNGNPITIPPDSLVAGKDHGQCLGIFTANGDIQMANSQSNGNLEIDASLATISQGGSGGLVNTGSTINTLNIVGGRIQNNIKNINTTTRNVFFDKRYASNNFAPPWFPSTKLTPTPGTTAIYGQPITQRTKWVNNTSYF